MHQLLIIDDQSVLADDLADMLPWGDIGIDAVHKAYSGKEALELLNAHPIDVVVTDIRMPAMSGLDLIREIKRFWKHTKCIVLSGYNDFEYAKQAIQLRTSDYLLKPVADEELMDAVRRAIEELDREWQEFSSLQGALASVREQLPKLREYLLLDLITGKQPLSGHRLGKKIGMYEIPFRPGDTFHLMLLRLEDPRRVYDAESETLIDYALTNMMEEVFADAFHLWHCKDVHGLFVCLLKAGPTGLETGDRELEGLMERRALQLQHFVHSYLKVGISVLTSKSGTFPEDVGPLYRLSVSNFRHYIGNDRELFVSLAKEPDLPQPQANALSELYRPPALSSLLEIGNWPAVEDKLDTIFQELEQQGRDSAEHILETYCTIAASLAAVSRKNRKGPFEALGADFYAIANGNAIRTVEDLREWTARVLDHYRNKASQEERSSRSGIVSQVQSYIRNHLDSASLHAISASVYLNPSYLSKIYKMETGEGISEYMLRVRMERAASLLRDSNEKIYDISQMLGYQKPSYFIQLFKKHYGVTPQEYRNARA